MKTETETPLIKTDANRVITDIQKGKLVEAAFRNGPLFILIVMMFIGTYNLADKFLDGFLEDYKRSVDAEVSLATDFRAFLRTYNPNYQPPVGQ